ncbi:hypothetical protein [Pandoraea pnomenusa]|uniref:hypothetical protein n=1 Tax=Pandoraea pnomenusa TaxID=93220 RepID=UPI00174C7019|nr:hypothetical protein [Pandoraea pnomenusa]
MKTAIYISDLISLLREVAALKRYDVNARFGGVGGKITLNVPRELIDRIDAAVKELTS